MYPLLLFICLALFACAAWREPRHGLYALAALLPSYLLRFSIGPIPFTLLEGFMLILAVVCLVRRREAMVEVVHKTAEWRLPILLFLLAATIGLLVSPDLPAALGVWRAYFIEPVLVFVLAAALLETSRQREHLFLALGAGALFVAAGATLQYALDFGIPAPWDVERRATSIFPYPNAVGLYLGPIMTLGAFALVRASARRDQARLLFWGVTVVASGVAIFLAQSEAALFAVPATLVAAGFVSPRFRRWSALAIVLGVLILAVFPAVRLPIQEKALLQDYSGQVRLKQWEETVSLLKERPLWGAGLSGYPVALEAHRKYPEIEAFQYPHNVLMNFWVELGLLGVAAVAWLGAIAVRTARASRKPRWIAYASLAALAEMLIHGLVDVPYFKNDLTVLTWLLLAVILASYDPTDPVPQPSRS